MNTTDIYKKIKAMRILKEWSQEDAAHKLGIAVSSYAKIERGETDVHLSRLIQIAEVMEVDLSQLLELSDHNILNILTNCKNNCTNSSRVQGNNIFLTETECAHELEKAQLLLKERETENAHLKKQVVQLEEIIILLKKNGN